LSKEYSAVFQKKNFQAKLKKFDGGTNIYKILSKKKFLYTCFPKKIVVQFHQFFSKKIITRLLFFVN